MNDTRDALGCPCARFDGWGHGFSGTSLLLALSCIFILTMVVPPGLATLVNRARIDRAQRQVAALAAQLGRALERQGADAAIGSADLEILAASPKTTVPIHYPAHGDARHGAPGRAAAAHRARLAAVGSPRAPRGR